MLDECKGDKLEDVLLLFSAAVVRKRVAARKQSQGLPVAQRLGSDISLPLKDTKSLLPLAIAHRASLTALLHRKEEQRSKYEELHRTFEQKSKDFQRRQSKVTEARERLKNPLPAKAAARLRQQIADNWTGSVEARDALLYSSGTEDPSDALLNSTFDDIWQYSQNNEPLVPGIDQQDLLQSLQGRLQQQNERLQRWKDFQKKLTNPSTGGDRPTSTDGNRSKNPPDMPQIVLNQHHVIRISPERSEKAEFPSAPALSKYEGVVSKMKSDVSEVGKRRSGRIAAAPQATPKSPSPEPQQAAGAANTHPIQTRPSLSHPSSWQMPQEPAKNEILPLKYDFFSPLKGPAPDLEDEMLPTAGSVTASPEQAPMEEDDVPEYSSPHREVQDEVQDEIVSDLGYENYPVASPTPMRLYVPSPDIDPEHPARGDFVHVNEATMPQTMPTRAMSPPPPVTQKVPRPSLAERARMSMGFGSSEDIHQAAAQTQASQTSHKAELSSMSEANALDRRASLADRTRQSMSVLSSYAESETKPRRPKHSRSRTTPNAVHHIEPSSYSYWDTADDGGMGRRDITPREKLFDQDADYASVFKSRPKIALSPVLSPMRDDAAFYMPEATDEGSSPVSSPLNRIGYR